MFDKTIKNFTILNIFFLTCAFNFLTMNFLLIDDDAISHFIHKKMLKSSFGEDIFIHSFLKSNEALKFLNDIRQTSPEETFIILLDLNMPECNGWDFLDRLDDTTGFNNEIYIVSSSESIIDKERAKSHKYIRDYICKPLSMVKIQSVMKEAVSLN